MADYFALLDLPRSPWLEPDAVKSQFARLSGPVHPDRVHQADEATRTAATRRYAELNAAQQTLADPRRRLRHLIELETGQPPGDVGAVPAHVSDLFFTVGKALRTADELVRKKQAATSPMVQAQVMREAVEGVASLQTTVRELEGRRAELDHQCRATGTSDIAALAGLHRDYSYVNRWLDQLRERMLQLTL